MTSTILSIYFLIFAPAPAPSQPSQLIHAARQQIGKTTGYDAHYRQLKYPGGDVPIETGVCSDVVIRSFRALGIDLQKTVHDDMAVAFRSYPQLWGLKRPDGNIDHRRVPNLMKYFERRGKRIVTSS